MAKSLEELIALYEQSRITKFNYTSFYDELHAYYKEQVGYDLYAKYFKQVECGVDIGLGWVPIYVDLVHHFADMMQRHPNFKITVDQVKQKFGSLRVYTHCSSINMPDDPTGDTILRPEHETLMNQVYQVVNFAERIAARTCETCGSPGKIRNNSWIRVSCEKHT